MDVMIDIETLSTRPNAVVLSVGAVWFDPENRVEPTRKTHWRLDVDTQTGKGRDIMTETMEWWSKQDPAVAAEAFSDENRVGILDFCKDLNRYVAGSDKIWCQGPQFDMVILENLYRDFEHHWNWQFWQIMDSRTLIHTARLLKPGYQDPRKSFQQNLHNAAEDSYYQALAVQQIIEDLA